MACPTSVLGQVRRRHSVALLEGVQRGDEEHDVEPERARGQATDDVTQPVRIDDDPGRSRQEHGGARRDVEHASRR